MAWRSIRGRGFVLGGPKGKYSPTDNFFVFLLLVRLLRPALPLIVARVLCIHAVHGGGGFFISLALLENVKGKRRGILVADRVVGLGGAHCLVWFVYVCGLLAGFQEGFPAACAWIMKGAAVRPVVGCVYGKSRVAGPFQSASTLWCRHPNTHGPCSRCHSH